MQNLLDDFHLVLFAVVVDYEQLPLLVSALD